MSRSSLESPRFRPLHIAVVGGGTGGHIFPLIAIIDEMQRRFPRISMTWFGRRGGIEEQHALGLDARFIHLPSGKWRRYFSFQNFTDLFRILGGVLVAFWCVLRKRPDILISKGGFQALPLLPVAWILRIPVIAHESDSVAGIATRVAERFRATIATTWPETRGVKNPHPVGLPIRANLFAGQAQRARARWNFPPAKPLLLVLGGSQGAIAINELVWATRSALLSTFSILHMTGDAHHERYHLTAKEQEEGYRTVGFLEAEDLSNLMACADVCVTRCGSGIIELLLAGIPSVAIPLPGSASDHQARNGHHLSEHGAAIVLPEKEATPQTLLTAIQRARELTPEHVRRAAKELGFANGAERLVDLIETRLSQ